MPPAKQTKQLEPLKEPTLDTAKLIRELAKHLADPLEEDIKARHPLTAKKPLVLLVDKITEARLELAVSASIDTEKFFRLYEAGKVSRADLLACMSIGKEKAEKLIDPKLLEKLVIPGTPKPKLTITRRKGTTFDLASALVALERTAKSCRATPATKPARKAS